MADTTDIEKKSLEAHVELCAERYRNIEFQLDNVKQDIADVKILVSQTHELVHDLAQQRNSQLLSWGLTIIGVLLGMCGWLVTTYVLK